LTGLEQPNQLPDVDRLDRPMRRNAHLLACGVTYDVMASAGAMNRQTVGPHDCFHLLDPSVTRVGHHGIEQLLRFGHS
jgi:hypothetical protein